jgi:pantoate kinase
VSREQEFFIRLSSDVVFRNKEAIKKWGDVKEIVAKEVQVILWILRDSDTAKKIEWKSHKEIVSILYDIHESSQKSLLDKRKEVWRNIFQ